MEERFLVILLSHCSPTTVVLLHVSVLVSSFFFSQFVFGLFWFVCAFWVGDTFVSLFVICGTWNCWPYCWGSLFGLLEAFCSFGHHVVTSATSVLSPNCETVIFIRGRSFNLCLSVLSICYDSLMEKRTKSPQLCLWFKEKIFILINLFLL